jgi:hypothetical protein
MTNSNLAFRARHYFRRWRRLMIFSRNRFVPGNLSMPVEAAETAFPISFAA